MKFTKIVSTSTIAIGLTLCSINVAHSCIFSHSKPHNEAPNTITNGVGDNAIDITGEKSFDNVNNNVSDGSNNHTIDSQGQYSKITLNNLDGKTIGMLTAGMLVTGGIASLGLLVNGKSKQSEVTEDEVEFETISETVVLPENFDNVKALVDEEEEINSSQSLTKV